MSPLVKILIPKRKDLTISVEANGYQSFNLEAVSRLDQNANNCAKSSR